MSYKDFTNHFCPLYLSILLVSFSFICFGQKSSLFINSRWLKSGESCYDTLYLASQSNFEEYYCDTKYKSFGKYKLVDDTITIKAYETHDFIRETFGKDAKKITDSAGLILISTTKYVIINSKEIQKVYFQDLISGYESRRAGWKYSKIDASKED
ncbi:hypothetical protein [Fulvivirga sp.]|uniref:hypothetical protein n=1 Tax=Fulvivirga sp. TaxID=1931237 RepID=UPI0032EEF718